MKTSDISDVQVLRAFLAAQRYRHTHTDNSDLNYAYGWLQQWLPECPFKVAYAAMERADDHELVEYGVSLRTGWLTENGEAFYRANT